MKQNWFFCTFQRFFLHLNEVVAVRAMTNSFYSESLLPFIYFSKVSCFWSIFLWATAISHKYPNMMPNIETFCNTRGGPFTYLWPGMGWIYLLCLLLQIRLRFGLNRYDTYRNNLSWPKVKAENVGLPITKIFLINIFLVCKC